MDGSLVPGVPGVPGDPGAPGVDGLVPGVVGLIGGVTGPVGDGVGEVGAEGDGEPGAAGDEGEGDIGCDVAAWLVPSRGLPPLPQPTPAAASDEIKTRLRSDNMSSSARTSLRSTCHRRLRRGRAASRGAQTFAEGHPRIYDGPAGVLAASNDSPLA